MRTSYDFSKMKGQKNPYTARLKQPITIRLDRGTVAYFKNIAGELGMPYQSLINLYLRDCAVHHKRIAMKWVGA
ncbi:MAG TPA: antitoxin [Elusimicrobia bacterium]|nr:antitoxin [Elusimicrobiota bacterium]HBT62052.1 antitoxin [Elusimicrobiota bacterium]